MKIVQKILIHCTILFLTIACSKKEEINTGEIKELNKQVATEDKYQYIIGKDKDEVTKLLEEKYTVPFNASAYQKDSNILVFQYSQGLGLICCIAINNKVELSKKINDDNNIETLSLVLQQEGWKELDTEVSTIYAAISEKEELRFLVTINDKTTKKIVVLHQLKSP